MAAQTSPESENKTVVKENHDAGNIDGVSHTNSENDQTQCGSKEELNTDGLRKTHQESNEINSSPEESNNDKEVEHERPSEINDSVDKLSESFKKVNANKKNKRQRQRKVTSADLPECSNTDQSTRLLHSREEILEEAPSYESTRLCTARGKITSLLSDIQIIRERYAQTENSHAASSQTPIPNEPLDMTNQGDIWSAFTKIHQLKHAIHKHRIELLDIRRRHSDDSLSYRHTFAISVHGLLETIRPNEPSDGRSTNARIATHRWSGENIDFQTQFYIKDIDGHLSLCIKHEAKDRDTKNKMNSCQVPDLKPGNADTDLMLAYMWVRSLTLSQAPMRPTKCRICTEILNDEGHAIITRVVPNSISKVCELQISIEQAQKLITTDGYMFISVQALPL